MKIKCLNLFLKGHPRLVKALATLYSIMTDIRIDPMTDIFITVGASAAMQATIQGLVDDGDEVIVVEPFFDSYDKLVRLAGGVAVYVPLRTKKVFIKFFQQVVFTPK